MKQPQQRTLNASRGRFDRRPLPLASLSGAALLLSLGLLQNAAAEPIRADAPLIPQLNSETAKIKSTITDPKGIASGADFLAPLATRSAVNVSGNGAASNATGNASIPLGAFSLEVNNEPEIARARARLEQANLGEVTSTLESQAVISGVTGASNAAATVTKNIFDASATGNQALTSIGIQASGTVALSNAGVRLISRQLNESPDISAQSTTATSVILDGASRANTATVAGNTTASQAVNNNADNTIAITSATGIDATGTRAAALTLRSTQEVKSIPDREMGTLPSHLTATTVNRTGVFAQDSNVSRGSFTVNDNQISANAQRNLASNVLGVAEGAISTGALPLFSLTNRQKDVTEDATISADTTAEVLIDVAGTGVGRNLQATISGNQISAAAGANTASSEVFLGTAGSEGVAPTRVGDLAGVSGTLDNIQRGASDVQATTQGYTRMVGGVLTGALSVSNNTTQASASGNQADNTFGAAANSADALDVSVTSVQRYGSTDVTPLVMSTAMGSAGIQANDVPAATTATVTGNTLASQAMVNTARNRASLDSTTTLSNSTLAVDNLQTSRASAESLTELEGFGVFSGGQLISDNVSVSGNLASAKATQNVATNALSVKAGAISGAATAETGGYGVYNEQKSFESTTATVATAVIPGVGPVSAGIFAPTSLPDNMSVTNNVLSAVARANVADNQLQASSTTTLNGASFLLGNNQINRGDATASITPAGLGVNNGVSDTLAPRVTVSGNQLEAAASGNAAFNALSVGAGTSFTASAAILNAQQNAGAITASIDSPTLGLQALNAVSGQLTSVTGNTVSATAYGNHAVNSVALSALPGQLSTSAALVSAQLNTGNVSAGVSNTFIGSNVTGVNGSTTVARNQVNASAVGNMAIGSMVIGSK